MSMMLNEFLLWCLGGLLGGRFLMLFMNLFDLLRFLIVLNGCYDC